MDHGGKVTAFNKTLGINWFDIEQKGDGRVRIISGAAFQTKEIDDAIAHLQKTNDNDNDKKDTVKPVPVYRTQLRPVEKRDLKWIELLRTLAMFLIVVCHAHDMVPFRGTRGAWWPAALSSVVRFAVPLFFIISGYFMSKGYGSSDRTTGYSTVFRRRIVPIIVNFFTWNIIYMVLMNVFVGMPILSFNTLWLLTTGYVHLYFIFVLMQLFLLYPLVHPFLDKRGAGIIFVVALISLAFYAVSDILLWTRGADSHFFEIRVTKPSISSFTRF